MAPTSSRSVRGFIAGRARAVAALAFALLAACSAEDASGSNDGLAGFFCGCKIGSCTRWFGSSAPSRDKKSLRSLRIAVRSHAIPQS